MTKAHKQLRAFSVVELIVAMVIVLLLVSITITWYQGPAQEAKVGMARVEAVKIAGMIAARQMETRRPYEVSSLPQSYRGRGEDPWGNPWRIAPAERTVSSPGPDGSFESAADDVVATWEDWSGPAQVSLPSPVATLTGGGSAQIEWGALQGLRELAILKTGAAGIERLALTTDAVAFADTGLTARQSYSYQIEAIDLSGRRLISPPTGVFLTDASPPSLEVKVEQSGARSGRVRLRVESNAHGSELARLTVGNRHFDLKGANSIISVEQARPARVSIAVQDRSGSSTTTDVVLP